MSANNNRHCDSLQWVFPAKMEFPTSTAIAGRQHTAYKDGFVRVHRAVWNDGQRLVFSIYFCSATCSYYYYLSCAQTDVRRKVTAKMSDNLAFLSAGFAAMSGLKISANRWGGPGLMRAGGAVESESSQGWYAQGPADTADVHLGIKELFSMTAMYMPDPVVRAPEGTFTVQIHVLKRGTQLSLSVRSEWKVDRLRAEVASKLGLSTEEVALIYKGVRLTDDGKELGPGLAMHENSLVYALKVFPGKRVGEFLLDPSALQPSFDYNLTGERDDGSAYWRGGYRYYRPYGWKRHAVRVLGQYKDDVWLGKDGIRTESTPGEWAVGYHGTIRSAVDPILEEGMKAGPGQLYGPGVYTSPALEKVAEYYGTEFKYNGKRYQLVLQNRVDPTPEHLTIIPPDSSGKRKDFPYWISPMQNPDKNIFHVRPYGILTREI